MAQSAKRFGLMSLSIVKMVLLVIAAGTVGFFVDQYDRDLEEKTNGTVGFFFDQYERNSKENTTILTHYGHYGIYGREEFFLFATAVGFFVAVLSLIIAITELHDTPNWAAAMFMAHSLCVFIFLVSSSLLAKLTTKYQDSLCEVFKHHPYDVRCFELIIGVVCGFVSMVLFIGDCVIYVVVLRQNPGISFVNMDEIAL